MKSTLLKTFLICSLAVFAPSISIGQDNLPLVTVTGKGEVKVTPDEVELRFGVERTNNSVERAKNGIDSVMNLVRKILLDNKIASSDLKMDYLQIQNMFQDGMEKSPRQYYRAIQGVSVVLKDISKYENFVSELIKAGINRIDNVEFRTSDLRKHQDAARDLAVKAAREKAEALAKSLGQSIGVAYSIEEFPENNFPIMRMANQSMDGGSSPESFGQISVTANVTVKFHLK
jgi:uncharacterized protein YggE